MAKKSAVVVRRSPMVSKARFEMLKAAGARKAKRTREVAAKRVGTIVGAGTGALCGYLEKTGKLAPKFTSPAALAVGGAVLAFVLPETGMGKGKVGQASAEAGAGLLAVAAYKLGLGQPVVGEDDSVEGDWSAQD
jgi:hypothetical protein